MTKVKMKIKKGDKVVVTAGKDKGVTGEVIDVNPSERRVTVRGANIVKKHQRPTQTSPGGIQKIEKPLHVSNVALADPKTGKPTRVGYRFLEDGKKVRVAKASGETVD